MLEHVLTLTFSLTFPQVFQSMELVYILANCRLEFTLAVLCFQCVCLTVIPAFLRSFNNVEINFPNGCITSYAINETACNATGGTWWFPAISGQQCTSVQGCYDVYLPTLQRSFSPKNEANCTSEYNYGTYQPYFQWTPAKWYNGVVRPLSWVSPQANTRYTYGPSIDLTQLYSIWEAGAYQRQALQLKVNSTETPCIDYFDSLKRYVSILVVLKHWQPYHVIAAPVILYNVFRYI